ncbi:efflux RND transporter periplasmic adaptor subunit [Mesoterricola silvestris]|uniref:RND transporter n=1 Tax=Mesoterricola silvestris TaxID=2927979 RepID=A0AA48KB57_9BACT|nr:efflux RND transporter periplasmic adaptor subunit [Mesoterricola silvestris]BDU74735.1 RND transporter [Mesoterricola silvestris]
MKPKQMWILGGGLVAVVAIGIAASRGDKGVPVQVATVARENIQAKVSANGKIQAVVKVDITANVMGQVTALKVKEGDLVKKGDLLLEIDNVRSKAAVESLRSASLAMAHDFETARARLEQARKDFARASANIKAGIISQSDFDLASTTLRTAQAAFDGAQQRVSQSRADLAGGQDALNKTRILAPMDGVVTAKRIELGETAVIGLQNQPGTVLVTISDMSRVEAEMEVDEASIPTVKMGQTAQVRIDAYPNQVFDGVVTEVGGSPIVQTNVNEAIKFKVKVMIKNPPSTIKPGLSNQADIFTGSRDQVLAIPLQALVMRDIKLKKGETFAPGAPREEEGVYVLEGGKAVFKALKTGLMGELNVEVLSGLKGGETLIMGPFKTLRELKGGEDVRVDKRKKIEKKES